MTGSILGNRVVRTEDPELLVGAAKYVADLQFDEPALHVAFVRSDIAHGRLLAVDVGEASSAPGVVGVYTADDLGLAGFQGMAVAHAHFARPPLATGKVRFVGDAIAAVVAESYAQAHDAARLVTVDYEPLPATTDAIAALGDTAPLIFDDHGSNLAMAVVRPPKRPLFTDTDRVVRGTYVNQRMAVAAIEPHAAASHVDSDGRLIVHGSTQMPHLMHNLLTTALGMDKSAIRIVTPNVGGGFGGKAGLYPEQIVVAAIALRLHRPIVWVATRSEDMLALSHSRGQVQFVELGCMNDGTFTDIHVRVVGDGGAYPGVGAYLPGGTCRMSHATYDFRFVHADFAVAVTNTTPMGAYRGAGRPEAAAMIERAVDQAALELGIDPLEIRRKNFIQPDRFPFTTQTGVTYDCGDYAKPLDMAAQAIGYAELRAEQTRRRQTGEQRLLGIGIASYVEITAGGSASEYGSVTVNTDGSATVQAGTSAHGQGHQTAFAMIVSDQTGIPIDRIRLAAVDTDVVPTGGGTGGSRSLQLGGSAVYRATESLVTKAKQLAARLLEADIADIVVDTEHGTVGVAGVPATALDWATLAERAAADDDAVDHDDGSVGLAAQLNFEQPGATFPFGTHMAVVEVDRDTGAVSLLRHIAVDDCGTVLNPLLVEGQQHGGAAAGISQTLYESIRYDDAGNPLSANFADYGLPSAAEFPSFEVLSSETATPYNPLGAKGIGEAATIGATPAVQNAVIDALAHLGVRHIDLPCTSEAVWQAMSAAQRGEVADHWYEPPAVLRAGVPTADIDEAGLSAAEGV